MRNSIFTSVSLLVLVLACGEDDPQPIHITNPAHTGTVDAEQNGRPWQGKAYVSLATYPRCPQIEQLSLGVYRTNEQGMRRETMSFSGLPVDTGRHVLSKRNYGGPDVNAHLCDKVTYGFYATLEDDGDAGGDGYELIETEQNWVEVVSLDTVRQEIRLRFQASFYRNRPVTNWAEDTVRFAGAETTLIRYEDARGR